MPQPVAGPATSDDVIAALDALATELGGHAAGGIGAEAAEIAETLARHAPEVAVVGQVKAGKTALVNALAGVPDFLPTDVNPATAAVTSLRLGQPWHPPGCVFRFFDRETWAALESTAAAETPREGDEEAEAAELRAQATALRRRLETRLGANFRKLLGGSHGFDGVDRDLLRRYVCAGDGDGSAREGRFSDMTRAAEIALGGEAGRLGPVTLVDTPGINDPFLVRERLTLEAVRRADVTIVVMSAHQAMTTVDLGLLRLLAGADAQRLVLFVNRIDEIEDPGPATEEIARRIRRVLSGTPHLARLPILFGSAVGARCGVAPLLDDLATRLEHGARARAVAAALADGLDAARRAERAAAELHAVPSLSPDALTEALDGIVQRIERDLHEALNEHYCTLDKDLAEIAERFATREAQAFEVAASASGRWAVDSTGLRHDLRAAHDRFAAAHQAAVRSCLAAVAGEIEALYRAFPGAAHVRVDPPEPPAVEPPVGLGQSMAVDLDRGSWLSRLGLGPGRARRAAKLRARLLGEARGIVREVRETQVARQSTAAREITGRFLERHATVLSGLAEGRIVGAGDPARLADLRGRLERLAAGGRA